jgi:hypothetical protein
MAHIWDMVTVLKPSELKADTGAVLDAAIDKPQYVSRKGVLLVITKAELTAPDEILSPWEQRAKVIDSFYDPNKAW